MPWTVSWRVFVDGADVTAVIRPLLMSITITDTAGATSDTCALSLDDTDGQIKLPRKGAAIAVFLQGVEKFAGVVDSAPWSFSRSAGRVLKVNAKGFDSRGKVKQGQAWHLDDATLGEALRKAGGKAGVSVDVDPAFASIERDYWSPDGQSFLGWGAGARPRIPRDVQDPRWPRIGSGAG